MNATTHRRLLLGAFAILAVAALPARAAEGPAGYLHVSWTEKDGLPGSYISSLAQDSDGYLWLIANGALVRFDGVNFVEWAQTSPTPLPDVRPSVLYGSRDGSFWIGLSGDGGAIRIKDRDITTFQPEPSGLFPGNVRSLVEDSRGDIWAGGQAGIARFRDGRWERVGEELGLPAGPVYSVFGDRGGDVWIGTALGVFHRVNERFELALPAIQARGFAEDAGGGVWITGLDHPFRSVRNPKLANLPPALLQSASGGWALEGDSKGNIWVATLGAGVWRVSNAEHGKPVIERFDRSRLSSTVVRSVLEDREGNIWVGTDNGLNRLTPSVLVEQPDDLESINKPVVAMTADQDGRVWVGTQTGLYQFTGNTSVRFDRRDGLPGVAIYAVHTDARGTVWAAGDQTGLIRREANGRFTAIPLPRNPSSLRIVALTSDRSGAIWLCDLDWGVFRWKDGQLTEVMPETTRRAAYSAMTDRSGRVWIGLVNRLLMVNTDGTTKLFGREDGLGQGRVTTVFEDSRGIVWAGTGVGLSRFDGKGRFVTLPLVNRGRRQNVTAIVEDGEANLWLGVLSGIMRITRAELDRAAALPAPIVEHTIYDMADGLNGAPIWLGSPTAARGGDGRLWFVTSSGLAALNPADVKKVRMPPTVLVEAITADDQRLAAHASPQLPANTSRLQIDYTALSLTVPTKVHFKYMLEGFDADWVDAGTRRQAFYTNLAPRTYRFRVKAANDGVWNEGGASWEFSIPPAFYETLWFRIAIMVAIAAVAAGAWRLRVRHVRDQFDLVLAERARMGREIHDTLLQSLVGVALQFDAVRSQVDHTAGPLRRELDRLRRQVELCIREARQSILDLRSPMESTEELSEAIRRVVTRQTRGSDVDFELVVTGTARSCGPRIDQQLLRIAQEAVANAVRHADATHVRLELRYDSSAVTLRVADNGRGFDPGQRVFTPQDHWGLANMKERADQIGAQFRLRSSPGAGTEIETVVPTGASMKAAS
jgi:signal transduction histidine kinase/ligand-binding sensor domain-containing protein